VIILDTNVISEMMEMERDDHVESWLNHIDPASLWLTAILVHEVKGGLDSMDEGRRKRRLLAAFDSLVQVNFGNRVAAFDHAAAIAAARIGAERDGRGRPVGANDTMITGIAVAQGAAIATRNVRHFDDLSVKLINPWDAPV
jgi:predicted nucleic acid-binding protein